MIYYFVKEGIKYGSINSYKVHCMGARDVGEDCEYGKSGLDEFIWGNSQNNVWMNAEWLG